MAANPQLLAAAADLAVAATGLVGAVLGRSRWWGVLLAVAAAAWLPLNNGVLEGPVLLDVGDRHGLTVADLGGVAGVLAGGLVVWPPSTWRGRRWVAARAGVLAAMVAAGLVAAATVTDVHADDRSELRIRREFGHAGQRSSLDILRSARTFPPVWQPGQYWNDLS